MPGFVGTQAGRYYAGVVTAIAAAQVVVRVSDEPDLDGAPVDLWATGTAAVNDKVTVLVQPTGRTVIVKG